MADTTRSSASSESSLRSASSDSTATATSSTSEDDVCAQDSARRTADDTAAAEVTKLRLQREQRLRRVLSQRHLGQTDGVPRGSLVCTRAALAEEDTVWLYTLTNSACFERLVRGVAATAPSALAGRLDAVLSQSNPLFYFNYRMSIPSGGGGGGGDGGTTLREAPVMERWRQQTPALRRKRPAPAEDSPSRSRNSGGDVVGTATAPRLSSASSGLVAQSMRVWEAHLAATLTREGETIQNFRLSRTKASYTEKKEFQAAAAWREYEREVQMQAQQREREMQRSLRRGEAKEP